MCNFPQYRGIDKEQFDRNTAFTSSYFPCVKSHESERPSTTKASLSRSDMKNLIISCSQLSFIAARRPILVKVDT